MSIEFTPINQVYEEVKIGDKWVLTQAQCNFCTGKNIQRINGKNICCDCGKEYIKNGTNK